MKRRYEQCSYEEQKTKLLQMIKNGITDREIQAQRLNLSLVQMTGLKSKIRKEGYVIPRG